MEWIPDEEYNKANAEKQAIEAQIALNDSPEMVYHSTWNEDGSLNNKTTRELTKEERIMVVLYEQKRNSTNNLRMLQ